MTLAALVLVDDDFGGSGSMSGRVPDLSNSALQWDAGAGTFNYSRSGSNLISGGGGPAQAQLVAGANIDLAGDYLGLRLWVELPSGGDTYDGESLTVTVYADTSDMTNYITFTLLRESGEWHALYEGNPLGTPFSDAAPDDLGTGWTEIYLEVSGGQVQLVSDAGIRWANPTETYTGMFTAGKVVVGQNHTGIEVDRLTVYGRRSEYAPGSMFDDSFNTGSGDMDGRTPDGGSVGDFTWHDVSESYVCNTGGGEVTNANSWSTSPEILVGKPTDPYLYPGHSFYVQYNSYQDKANSTGKWQNYLTMFASGGGCVSVQIRNDISEGFVSARIVVLPAGGDPYDSAVEWHHYAEVSAPYTYKSTNISIDISGGYLFVYAGFEAASEEGIILEDIASYLWFDALDRFESILQSDASAKSAMTSIVLDVSEPWMPRANHSFAYDLAGEVEIPDYLGNQLDLSLAPWGSVGGQLEVLLPLSADSTLVARQLDLPLPVLQAVARQINIALAMPEVVPVSTVLQVMVALMPSSVLTHHTPPRIILT